MKQRTIWVWLIMPLLSPLWSRVFSPEQGEGNRELEVILKKASAYCEKLKSVAFHFVCHEVVVENVPSRQLNVNTSTRPRKTNWSYDYQIISKDGKIDEHRTLLRKNRRQFNQANAKLESRFCSFFTFYLLVTVLAREKQASLIYELEGWEKVNKRRAARLGIDSMGLGGPTRMGKAWVDPVDGSVLKIALDQNAVQGFEDLQKKAQARGETLSVSDTHWYAVEKGGLRFPSRTEINEVYVFDGRYLRATGQVSVAKTTFFYSKYRFFSISLQVAEEVGSTPPTQPIK